MCDPVTMGVILAASTAGAAYQQNQVAKAQNNSNALAIQNEMNSRQKANAALTQGITQIQNSNPTAQTQTNTNAYDKAVQIAKDAAMNNGSAANSTAFNAAKTAAGDRVSSYGDKLASFMGGIDAAGQQRVNEQGIDSNMRGNIGTINSDARAQNIADNARTQSIHANPWLSALFSVGQAYGSAGMAGGLAGAAMKSAALSDLVNSFASKSKKQSTNPLSVYGPAMNGSGSTAAGYA